MYSKGRQKPAKGNQFKRAKLSPAIVAQMRLLGSDMPNKQLGQRFGVSQSVVSEVLRGKSWAHVPIPLPPQNGGKFRSGEFAYQSKLTRAIVDACRKEYARGKVTMTALAKRYGITKGTMRHAIVGITWR